MKTIKNNLKSALAVVGVFLFALVPAFGQAEVSPIVLGTGTGQTTMTNAVPSGTTESTLVGAGVDLRAWRSVSIQLEGTCIQGANAGGNLTLKFARSATHASPALQVYETTPPIIWSVPAGAINSTNSVANLTNLPLDSISGITGLKLVSVQAISNSVSGLKVTVLRKR